MPPEGNLPGLIADTYGTGAVLREPMGQTGVGTLREPWSYFVATVEASEPYRA